MSLKRTPKGTPGWTADEPAARLAASRHRGPELEGRGGRDRVAGRLRRLRALNIICKRATAANVEPINLDHLVRTRSFIFRGLEKSHRERKRLTLVENSLLIKVLPLLVAVS